MGHHFCFPRPLLRLFPVFADVAELADAPDLGSGAPGAYEFESLRPHQKRIVRV